MNGSVVILLTFYVCMLLAIVPLLGAAAIARKQAKRCLKERYRASKRIEEYNRLYKDDYAPFD